MPRLIPEDQELGLRLAHGGKLQTGDNRLWSVIPTHGIHGQYVAPAHRIPAGGSPLPTWLGR